jgi:kinesin family protein 2/24
MAAITISDAASVRVVVGSANVLGRTRRESRAFRMDHVFASTEGDGQVADVLGPMIENASRGRRACVLAYGRSGSGKTHTIARLMDAAVRLVFADGPLEVQYSLVEVYNDKVLDLASPRKRQIDAGSEEQLPIASPGGLAEVARRIARREVAPTQNNTTSSRSHLVLSFTVRTVHGVGRLSLVDLAGNERIDVGRKEETIAINKSLSALKGVLIAIRQKSKNIPFRGSPLTQVLEPSLDRHSHAVILFTISPLEEHLRDTVVSLALADGIAGG